VESAVNEILSKRVIKKQQMRPLPTFIDVRVAVLNKTLRGSPQRRYPAVQTPNPDIAPSLAA
jgi:hypothetical protein